MDVLAVKTLNLSRTFKSDSKDGKNNIFWALNEINLEIPQGIIFGLLGPNGAGKTTLIKILTTLLLPTSGQAYVLGYNVDGEHHKIKPLINMVSGGEYCGYGILTLVENLWMFSQFYNIPSKIALKRINEMLEIMNLSDKANTKVSQLSTGMRQKMNFIRSVITDPKILFLDEPTLGLDVNAARETRKFVMDWVKNADEPKTVILTTHYMHEADEMCDRLAIINKGKILANDTPKNLKKREAGGILYKVIIDYSKNIDKSIFYEIRGIIDISINNNSNNETELLYTLESDLVLTQIIQRLNEKKLNVKSVQKVEFTLEDAFIKLVGEKLNKNGEEKNE